MRKLIWNNLSSEDRAAVLTRPVSQTSHIVEKAVAGIIDQVRDRGDSALIALSKEFDGFISPTLRAPRLDISEAGAQLSADSRTAIQSAYDAIRMFHEAQLQPDLTVTTFSGVACQLITRPIPSVGLYVPGGSAPLVSTMLMLGVPAQIASCSRVVVCSPPPINPAILFAAALCGIEEIYQVGGAQAIAAMALGTASIHKVDKIFGPGNGYVSEAKRQVRALPSGPAIDMIAGPTELFVIADESSNPSFIAADLLSQAEHGSDSQVILATLSPQTGSAVQAEVANQIDRLSRREIIRTCLESSVILECDSTEQAVCVANDYAPEHLAIYTEDAEAIVPQIQHAGSIFLGPWSPEAAGDYATGPNHVLPTYGSAVHSSCLSLKDFQKTISVQKLSSAGLQRIGPTVIELAQLEQLDAHSAAVSIRLDALKNPLRKGTRS